MKISLLLILAVGFFGGVFTIIFFLIKDLLPLNNKNKKIKNEIENVVRTQKGKVNKNGHQKSKSKVHASSSIN